MTRLLECPTVRQLAVLVDTAGEDSVEHDSIEHAPTDTGAETDDTGADTDAPA